MSRILKLVVIFIATLPFFSFGQSTLKEYNDILYLEPSEVEVDSLQRLNLLLPSEANGYPLLIWIGGGAWSYVNRNMEMDLGKKFTDSGIAFASIGHRLSSATWKDPSLSQGIKHPEHVKDVSAAFKWLYDHADEYGFNRENIFVGGFSSGAHLAALLSMDNSYLDKNGLSTQMIKGIIPIAGAYDIQNYYNVFKQSETQNSMAETHVMAVFGENQEDLKAASPTEYIEGLTAPMLLISENNTYNYTRIFEDKIRSSEFRNIQVLHINSMGHGELWRHLSYDESSHFRDLIIGFILNESKANN